MPNEWAASEVLRALREGRRSPDDQDWVAAMSGALVVDSPFDAANIAILLRDRRLYEPALQVAEGILALHPDDPFALFEMAFTRAAQGRNAEALPWAERAAASAPRSVAIRVFHAHLLGAAGDPRSGIDLLNRMTPTDPGDHERQNYAIQWLRFIDRFPRRLAEEAAAGMLREGRRLEAEAVSQTLMQVVREPRPYAFARIGDGEGAWCFADPVDEAAYSVLFRENRRSFLNDWFGSDQWLDAPEFQAFARRLAEVIACCDLIGGPDQTRMAGEYETMGTRGAPGQLNMLRKFGWLDPVVHRWTSLPEVRFCSSNVHMDLIGNGFYPELVRAAPRLGVITSHRGLPQVLEGAGASVTHAVFVPGDSRNFWRNEACAEPQRQWPDIFEQVSAQLGGLDLRGFVFLVSAGFVGKQYLPVLKAQGAAALDIGTLSDRWMERGAVW